MSAAERCARFHDALGYMKPARDALAEAAKSAPGRKEIQIYLEGCEYSVALASLEAGLDLAGVKATAQALLANNTDSNSWNYGNVIYNAHSLLGRVAMREGKLEEAKKHLLSAGRTPGSPQINSGSLEFILARELVEYEGRTGAEAENNPPAEGALNKK